MATVQPASSSSPYSSQLLENNNSSIGHTTEIAQEIFSSNNPHTICILPHSSLKLRQIRVLGVCAEGVPDTVRVAFDTPKDKTLFDTTCIGNFQDIATFSSVDKCPSVTMIQVLKKAVLDGRTSMSILDRLESLFGTTEVEKVYCWSR